MTRPRITIEIDDESLCISRSREAVAFRWNEIRRVVAYKRDCLAADQLCFSISDGDWETELNEDMEGWPELLRQLPARLHEFPAEWEWSPRLAQPAVANATILFER